MDTSFTVTATDIFVVMGWASGIVMLFVLFMFVQDVVQSKHAVRRNFPVIGRMRYFLERQGDYFRQYFFAHDREEMPFNRATRNWVYRTAKDISPLIGFGSSNDLRQSGSVLFVNDAFPVLEEDAENMPPLIIGPDCPRPFESRGILNISGMSFGALSGRAVGALSQGAAQAGIWMNTGEGGLSPYHLEGNCDLIHQIGTAKYGLRDEHGNLSDERIRNVPERVRAFEIKLSQGAKPGKGGVLPGHKVTAEIAAIRGIPEGKPSSSPNRHKEIANNDDLLDMIQRVREVSGRPVGIKFALGSGRQFRALCDAIVRRGTASAPDFVTVDGSEGGTGAAPQVLADHMGLPLREALPAVVDILVEYGLRERIRVVASGKLLTSANVAWALCLGADVAVSARGFLFSLGCIQSLQCHLDTCPTGITTQNPRLQKGLDVEEKAKRVATYAHWVDHEVNVIAHSCGLAHARQFRREHARIVQRVGKSVGLEELYPYPEIRSASA